MFSAFRCNYYWFTTGRSSPARVAAFPGLPSATGRVSFGRPVGSSRTLTTGLGTGGPEPPSVGRMREGDFPPLAIPVGDEGEFTHVILLTLSAWSMRFVPTNFRSTDVALGFVWDPLIPGQDLNSIPSRYLIDWGVCPKNVP